MLEGLFLLSANACGGHGPPARSGIRARGDVIRFFLVPEETCHFIFLIKMTGNDTGSLTAVLSKFKKEVDYEVVP
jgi:hypothetical protein